MVCGCARTHAHPPVATHAVRDGLGRVVHVPFDPARLISLAPSSTEILFAIGAGEKVVAVDGYSDYPPEVRARQRIGSDLEPSLERIVALKPEIVFTATSANSEATVNALERLGIAVFVSRSGSLAEIFTDIAGIGDASNREREADALSQKMRAELDLIGARARTRPPVSAVVVVWPEPLTVAGAGSHVHELLQLAGGTNLAADSPQPFPTYSTERLLKRAPEVLIIGTHAQAAPPLATFERLTSIPAVQNHRVHLIDGDLLFRPGPRIIEGARQLEHLLHPELK